MGQVIPWEPLDWRLLKHTKELIKSYNKTANENSFDHYKHLKEYFENIKRKYIEGSR